jgi:hypothetical protein
MTLLTRLYQMALSAIHLHQWHVAAAGSDQLGEIGILRVAARLAPDMHPVSGGARDRAGRRQFVGVRPALRHQRPKTSVGLRTRWDGAFASPITILLAPGRLAFPNGMARAAV